MDPNLVDIVQLKDVSYPVPLANRQLLLYNGSPVNKWENKPINDIAALSISGGMEKVVSATVSSVFTVNLANGNVFYLTYNASTSLAFSGATANTACSFTLYVLHNGTRTITWPGSVRWADRATENLSSGSGNRVDAFVFESIDGGAKWFGSVVGRNFAP